MPLDAQALLTWAEGLPAPLPALAPVALLRRVFEENYEVGEDGLPERTAATPPGGVQSPHEAQAQWCSKSTPTRKKEWVGYKAQVGESVQDSPRPAKGVPTANFIVSIITQAATGSDLAGMAESQRQQQEMGMEPAPVTYADTACVSADSLAQAAQEGRQLQGPVQPSQAPGGKFASEAFDVHMAEQVAVCPAGKSSVRCYAVVGNGKNDRRFEWARADCAACTLRGRCFSEAGECKKLTVGGNHAALQQRRREMRTDEFRRDMCRRNGIEGTQSELVRGYGLRRARYRGMAKVSVQNGFIGAACNLRRLHRLLAWLSKLSKS